MDQLEYMEIEDIEVFEVLNNTTRVRIIRYLEEPRSIREVAELLDVPPTRLYYHFNLLEEAGIIEVVETRKAGAMLQKIYRSRARGFRPSPQMARGDYEPHELAKITAGVVLDGARVDSEEGLTEHFTRIRAGIESKLAGSFGRSIAFMTEEQAEAFSEKLHKLLEDEFDANDQEKGSPFGFTFAFFPLAGTGESAR
ncbi:MAG TPA: helix-turn-helix domain-containing protein [Acidimicrobiia bacterium]|nr:helix-turn-helix domain-containing protein [Acidimicrobiia bacterium]